MSNDPSMQVFAVTGGASGIGEAAVRLFASRGHRVVALDLRGGELPPMGEDRGPGACWIECDVGSASSVNAAFDRIDRAFGRLDGLVNSAGVESKTLVSALDDDAWDRVQDVNVKGTLHCMQAAWRLMRERRRGAIVNVSSIAGKRISYSGDAAYTASKSAVLGLTRHAAFEFAADGVRVNAVCPGPTLTPMITRNLSAERIRAVAETVPLGRWVDAMDVAHAIEFLATDASAMCTGTTIDVDGGVLVSNGSRYSDYFAARQSTQPSGDPA